MKKIIVILIFLSFCVFVNNFFIAFTNDDKTEQKIIQKIVIPKVDYKKAISAAWEWFINNQDEDFLAYEYDFKNKENPDSYHPLREMWALWSIWKLNNFLQDDRYKQLSERGIEYFEKYFIYDKENDFIYVDITPKKIKLWYSAFMILSLLESEHPKKDEYLEKLWNWILFLQDDKSWKLRTYFYLWRNTWIDYYPWEALIALMKLYNYTKEQKYIDAVRKAFPYYLYYFKNNKNTAFVPWQSRAYYELYQIDPYDDISNFVFEMNDYMLSKNNPQLECSNFDFKEWITTAVFMEWVLQAYKLAIELNEKEKANCYKNFIIEGSFYISKLQILDTDDVKAYWWFKWSNKSNNMRVDRNQHASMSLIEAHDLGLFK